MDSQILQVSAYGLIFFLGLALVLRPFVILRSLIFRPGFVVLAAMLAFGVRGALVSAPADTAPILAGSLMAFGLGSAIGFPLRILGRGGF